MSEDEQARNSELDERVLILVKGARDAELTREILLGDGVTALVCATVAETCERVREGAACVVVAEEMLNQDTLDEFAGLLAEQPAWSDLPIVIFSAMGRASRFALAPALAGLGNVVVLDRPIQVRSMLASVHAAVRSRKRQYEARHAIEARDRFLAMLGHELRNPLAAIRAAVTILAGRSARDTPPKEIVIAERQSVHLTRLVDDLLDVARIIHGKIALDRDVLDVVEILRGAVEALDPRAAAHGITFELRVLDQNVWVDGDRARLDQVVTNLLSNAIKFTPRGGKVEIEVGIESDSAVITVADSGIGLAPEMLDRIFEVFTQVDDSRDRARGGIGIGLSLVRNLVRLHGGEVEAASAGLGRGATFRVSIPRVLRRPEPAQVESRADEASAPRRRIVLVEDNCDVRDTLQELLEETGHDVACAEDGPGGVERILALKPDIAFVDLGLPEFDGFELARRVRAAGSTVRLIAVSGYGQAKDKKQAREAGFDEHLTKPVGIGDVERAILRAPT